MCRSAGLRWAGFNEFYYEQTFNFAPTCSVFASCCESVQSVSLHLCCPVLIQSFPCQLSICCHVGGHGGVYGWSVYPSVRASQRQDRFGSSSPHLTKTDSYLLTPDTDLMLHSHAEGVIALQWEYPRCFDNKIALAKHLIHLWTWCLEFDSIKWIRKSEFCQSTLYLFVKMCLTLAE